LNPHFTTKSIRAAILAPRPAHAFACKAQASLSTGCRSLLLPLGEPAPCKSIHSVFFEAPFSPVNLSSIDTACRVSDNENQEDACGVFREALTMIYIYRLGLGKWALLCLLFIGGVFLAIQQYPDGFDPNTLPPTSAGIPLQQSEAEFPCSSMVYSTSQDGVHYVRETGGGTVFAARMNQRVIFYQLNSYGYMMQVGDETLDTETAGRLSKALLQCMGPWLPSGAWFTLSAQAKPEASLN
jgi:hypothetical protein